MLTELGVCVFVGCWHLALVFDESRPERVLVTDDVQQPTSATAVLSIFVGWMLRLHAGRGNTIAVGDLIREVRMGGTG